MSRTTPSARLARLALACVLACGLIPAAAHASETATGRSVVEQLVDNAAEATARYAATGNRDNLRDVSAYESDAQGAVAQANEMLPSRYDLRDEGVVTPVKSQSPWGTCWSFGAAAACETSIMSELGWSVNANQTVDLSELHAAWFAYTPLPDSAGSQAGEGRHSTSTDPNAFLNEGGFPYTVTSVLSSSIGPVSEAYAPYRNKEGIIAKDSQGNPVCYAPTGDWSVDESLRFLQAVELEESCVLPSPAGKDANGSYYYNQAGTDAIKKELLAGRAVEIGFAADTSRPGQTDPAKYIDTETWAHYTYDENAEVTHAVAIVGWDDSYSKSNFLKDHQPEHDGAWIVKNSWGSVAEEFPNKNVWGVDGEGFFYLSYDDKSISIPESFNFYTENYGQAADYYLINQYDYLPSDSVTSAQRNTEAAMANVFEAEESQRVRSLSCETAKPNTTATYELYRLKDGFANPRDGELLTTVIKTHEYGGYHRIELDEGSPMEQGQLFSVVVTLECESGYEVIVDRAVNKNGMPKDSIIYSVGVVNPGESYLLEEGAWSDWSAEVADMKAEAAANGEDFFDYDNFAIKAYADPMGAPPIHEAVNVPDLTGLTEADALAALEQVGLRGQAGAPEYSDTVEPGRVLRQDTEAGAEVDKGYLVTYVLSLGKDPAAVAPPSNEKPVNPTSLAKKSLASTGDATLPFVAALTGFAAMAALVAAGSARARERKRRGESHR